MYRWKTQYNLTLNYVYLLLYSGMELSSQTQLGSFSNDNGDAEDDAL